MIESACKTFMPIQTLDLQMSKPWIKTNKQTKKQPNVGGRDQASLSVTIQDYANSSIPSFML